jgi:hypothetical protein
MMSELKDRHPKGTYKVQVAYFSDGRKGYCLKNLATGLNVYATTIWELLKSIEDDLTTNKFPQSAMRYRTWGAGNETERKEMSYDIYGIKVDLVPRTGDPTFIIRVLYRQNATWQGTIQWIEGRQMRLYRSMNELLSLMDEAAGYKLSELENNA